MPAAGRGCSLSDNLCLLLWAVPGLGSRTLPLSHGDEGNDGETGLQQHFQCSAKLQAGGAEGWRSPLSCPWWPDGSGEFLA